MWRASEDSRKLNTSYIERLNLNIRQGSAYIRRRTLSHARRTQRLEDHLELLRCHYNFLRPHRPLKFGREVRTPAMQACLTQKQLTFREVFMSVQQFLCLVRTVCVFIFHANSHGWEDSTMSEAADPQLIAEAPCWLWLRLPLTRDFPPGEGILQVIAVHDGVIPELCHGWHNSHG